MEYTYESNYTDNKVRPDGYLVEVFMERKYKKKKMKLPQKFWNDPAYKKEFFANLSTVRGIFKTYEERGITSRTIIVALTGKDAQYVTWLKDERVDALIEAQIVKEKQKDFETVNIDTSDCSTAQPQKRRKKRSTLSILRELDGNN